MRIHRTGMIVGFLALASLLCSEAAAQKMYWTDTFTGRVQRANLDGTVVEDLVVGSPGPRGITLDLTDGKIYWTDSSGRAIRRSNLDGTNVEDLITSGLAEPRGIALDLAAGKMYWVDYRNISVQNGVIQRANLDGTDVEDVVVNLVTPFGLEFDLASGHMYWVDGGPGLVQRANLDGSEVTTLVSGLSQPIDVALDLIGGKMYWTDGSAGVIQRANLDGSQVETLITNLEIPLGLALDLNDAKIYWTASGHSGLTEGIVRRANLDGSGIEDLVHLGLLNPREIALDTAPCLTDLACSDGDPCSTDFCSDGACVSEPHFGLCDDGNECTVGDTCETGSCIGEPVSDLPCDDGGPNITPCTDGICSHGTCISGPPKPGECPLLKLLVTEVNGTPCVTCPTSELPADEVFPGDLITIEAFVSGWDDDPDVGQCRSGATCSVAAQDCQDKVCNRNNNTLCAIDSDCPSGFFCIPDECLPFRRLLGLDWNLPLEGFGNESVGDLELEGLPCLTSDDCRHGFDSVVDCTCAEAHCFGNGICSTESIAFVDRVRSDYIFKNRQHLIRFVVQDDQINWNGGVAELTFEGLIDSGQPLYLGTFILTASLGARGIYSVDVSEPVAVTASPGFPEFPGIVQEGVTINLCDVLESPNDCNNNSVPDECERDTDGDGVIDACDSCPFDAPDDSDGDGVCDSDDICPGFDDGADGDGDGVPDGCDVCPVDNLDDSDGDGVCDSDDICPGADDNIDRDGDGVPDGCDVCPQGDDNAGDAQDDDDGDGVINCNDKCLGVDDAVFGPECEGAIPAASQWGLIVLALFLMVGGKLFYKFGVKRGVGP